MPSLELKEKREAYLAERMREEHHTAQLRIEASGLESRIVNMRAILLQLESQRDSAAGNANNSCLDLPVATEPRADDDADMPESEVEKLAGELADQRLALLEQIDQLATARERWREEEARIVEEMEELGEQLRLREDKVSERETAAAFEEDNLDKERVALGQVRDHLDLWQSRLKSREASWKAESSRAELDIQRRTQSIDRREKAVGELCRKWSEPPASGNATTARSIGVARSKRQTWLEMQSGYEQARIRVAGLAARRGGTVFGSGTGAADPAAVGQGPRGLPRSRLKWLDSHVRKSIARSEAELTARHTAINAEAA